MKLSEAIRLNGMMKPQGRGPGSMISQDAPCALGGALQSIGKQPKTGLEASSVIDANWPFVHEPATCPCGIDHFKEMLDQRSWIEKVLFRTRDRKLRDIPFTILTVILSLNDIHEWTRTQIADWVATVEPEEVQDSSTPSCTKVRWTWTPADLCPICHSMGVRFDWGLDVNKCCNCGAVEVTGGWCAPPKRSDLHCVMT